MLCRLFTNIYPMKKTILLLFLAGSFSGLQAQVRRIQVSPDAIDTVLPVKAPDAQTMNRRKMFKELALTREQMQRMKAIREESRARQEDIENNNRLSEDERRQQLRSLKQEQVQKKSRVLSADQLEKLKRFRQYKKPGKKMSSPNGSSLF